MKSIGPVAGRYGPVQAGTRRGRACTGGDGTLRSWVHSSEMGKHGGGLAAFWRPAITSSVHTRVPEALGACPRSHPGHQHNSGPVLAHSAACSICHGAPVTHILHTQCPGSMLDDLASHKPRRPCLWLKKSNKNNIMKYDKFKMAAGAR